MEAEATALWDKRRAWEEEIVWWKRELAVADRWNGEKERDIAS